MSVSVKNLKFSYSKQDTQPSLRIDEWRLNTGESVFLQGASGSGKSTLLNIIAGILPITAGEVSVLDQRVDKMSGRQRDKFRAKHIGYVFQQFNLIPYLNCIENIQLAAHFSGFWRSKRACLSAIETLLAKLSIDRNQWHQPAATLSIGQQQRVAIARALINQPKLLIVDEPTSSLDQQNRDNFMSLLMTLVKEQQSSLIFVSHDMALANYFTRIDTFATINQQQSLNHVSAACL